MDTGGSAEEAANIEYGVIDTRTGDLHLPAYSAGLSRGEIEAWAVDLNRTYHEPLRFRPVIIEDGKRRWL